MIGTREGRGIGKGNSFASQIRQKAALVRKVMRRGKKWPFFVRVNSLINHICQFDLLPKTTTILETLSALVACKIISQFKRY